MGESHLEPTAPAGPAGRLGRAFAISTLAAAAATGNVGAMGACSSSSSGDPQNFSDADLDDAGGAVTGGQAYGVPEPVDASADGPGVLTPPAAGDAGHLRSKHARTTKLSRPVQP